MSEYMMSSEKGSTVPVGETLFDDALIDEIAHKNGVNQDDVRRQYGIEVPVFTPEPTNGAYVTLEARTIAVSAILEGINRRNKAVGASHQADETNSRFRGQYSNPEEVASIMCSNAKSNVKNRKDQLDILTATQLMIDAGFDPNQVIDSQNLLREEVGQFEGTGRKNVNRRTELKRKVKASFNNAKSL